MAMSLSDMTALERDAMAGLLMLKNERRHNLSLPNADPPQPTAMESNHDKKETDRRHDPPDANDADNVQTATVAWVLASNFDLERIPTVYVPKPNGHVDHVATKATTSGFIKTTGRASTSNAQNKKQMKNNSRQELESETESSSSVSSDDVETLSTTEEEEAAIKLDAFIKMAMKRKRKIMQKLQRQDSDEEWSTQHTKKINRKRKYTSSGSNKENQSSSWGEQEDVKPSMIETDMIPIGAGHAKVPAKLYHRIEWSSHTTATRKLLTAVFSRDILATHSLTGKPSPAFPDKPAKKKLDASLVHDIVVTVATKCRVPESVVRTNITTKCADESKMLRSRLQNNGLH